MRLGILSDTHNEMGNTQAALSAFRSRGVGRIIHCGDLAKPSMVSLFEGWQVDLVLGNVDHKRGELVRAVSKTYGPHRMHQVFQVMLEGMRIAACHGHDSELLRAMIDGGEYDLVLHGHLHAHRDDVIGPTRVICPGALGGTCHEPRSICVFDLITRAAEFIHV